MLSDLSGVEVKDSQFKGSSVVHSNLQGADISSSQLNGADISNTNLWRVVRDLETSLDHVDHREQIRYSRGDDVNDASINAWIATVPAGQARDRMTSRMAVLRAERKPEEDAEGERDLREALGDPPPTLRDDLTRYLDRLVCQEIGEAVHGVAERMSGLRALLSNPSFDRVALARRFLDPTCLGEKHLKDDERARLRRVIRDSESTPAP